MSASSSAEKNLSNLPESNLPKRSIIGLDRFNLSDEELHNIRIHAAVYKYNNFRSNTCIRRMGDRRNQLLPFKRKLLKSSTKNKACDDSLEEARNFKRSCNRYQGVGNFPTVHLNKSPVVCRPIKRHTSNELVIHYPELPMNRFLSHISDPNSDLKASSTRSVLDVLQDLSRKRIHSKDDADNSKIKSKGLGGDAPLDIEAPYKPLFVQKPKNNVVLTKDSTTQTLDAAPTLEPTNTAINTNNSTPAVADPKAELRRKLARQNNEIFASLSSSILSPFSIKRKLDKSLPTAESGQHRDDPLKKRPRLATKDFNIKLVLDGTGSRSSNSADKNSNSNKPEKLIEKPKILETSPKVSPSKDRLMNIYFDMQNGNPKAQIFQRNGVDENEKESLKMLDNESPSLLSPNSAKKCVSFNEQVTVLTFDKSSQDENSGFTKVKRDHSRKKKNSKNDDEQGTSDFNTDPTISKDFEKDESEKIASSPPPAFSFGKSQIAETADSPEVKKSESNVSNSPAGLGFSMSNAPNFGFGSSPSSTSISNFNITSTTTTVSSPLAENPIFSTKIPASDEKQDSSSVGSNQGRPAFKPLNFESPITSKQIEGGNSFKTTDFSTFKFGNSGNALSNTTTTAAATCTTETLNSSSSAITSSLISSPGSSQAVSSSFNSNASFFGLNQQPSTATSSSPPTFSSSAFGQMSTSSESKQQTTGLSGTKPQFSFGPIVSSVTSSATIIDPKAPIFSFGQSQQSTPIPKTSASATTENKIVQQGGLSSGGSGGSSLNQTAQIFSFGSKPETQNGTAEKKNSSQNNAFGSSSTSRSTFGQVPVTTQTGTLVQNSTTNAFGQSNNGNQNNSFLSNNSQINAFGQNTPTSSTFSFGQKPAAIQEVSSNVKTDLFGAKSSSNFAFTFGQKQSSQEILLNNQTATTGGSAFGSNPQANLFAFGQKPPETSTASLQNNTAPVNTFAQMQSTSFGQNSNAVSASATPSALSTSSAFQTNSNSLIQNSNQIVPPFGQPNTTQSSTTFGQPKSQPLPLVGQPSSQPAFGQNTAPLFGTKTSAFGSTGVSASFGTATQSTQQPFSQNIGKPSNAFGTSSSGFFNETPTTQAPLFGQQQNATNPAFGTTSVFGQSSSQESAFGQKQVTPFGQNSSVPSTPFGQTTSAPPPFGQSSQFSFGSSSTSSNIPSFPTAPPNTTASVFGSASSANSASSTFNFGNSSAPSTGSTQSPFSFGNQQTSESFKFGANQNKETPAFGGSSSGSNTSPFSFGSQTNNNNNNNNNSGVGVAEPNAKPAAPLFNFGASSSATSSNPGFNFGTNPSPPVFSFGGSGSSGSGSSSSTFSFGGTPQPGGPMFGQTATPSPSGAFSIPGTFSIGSSGTSQSRPRAAVRHRRRP